MSGAITTNSTFDGRNVSVDGTKLDGIAAGATNTCSSSLYRSAIAVGDGGLTQKNFTTTLKNKLDGVAAGATNTAAPYYTGAIPNATASATGLATSTQITKLDGIEAGATNVTNNNQLTNGAGYITNADDGDAATFGGSLPSEYVKTDQKEALGSQANAMTISGSTITLRRGDGSTDTVTTPNTTYSVGDGGLTQNNFTNADHTKLNGIAVSANNYSFPYTVSSSAGNSTVVQRHSSGYIFANYFNTTPNTVTSGVTQVCVETGNDGYIRHGTAAAIRTFVNVADGANNYTHPNDGVDYGAANTGANIISDVAVNALGHVTGFSTRALTLANLGYTGDSDANNLVPAVTSNGSSPSLGTGISAAEMRSVIGAGTSNLAIGTTSSTAMAGNTTIGATTAQANAIIANTAKTGITSAQASAITANTAKTSYPGYAGTMLREDNRIISPSELTSGRLKFGFTSWGNNNTSPYADFLHMRSYTDSSGGSDNMVMFKKSGIGMRIWQQTYGSSTAYASYADVWTSGDFTSTHVTNLKSANLTALAGATTMPSLSVDFLEAGTINADHITANTIQSTHLEISDASSSTANRIHMDGTNNVIEIWASSVLRVKIGNLA